MNHKFSLSVPFVRYAELLNYPPSFAFGPRRIYDHLLLYYLAGEGEVLLDGRAHRFQAETLMLVPPRILNQYPTTAHDKKIYAIHFDWTPRKDTPQFTVYKPAEEPVEESLFRPAQCVPHWDWDACPSLDLRGRPRVRQLLHEVVSAYQVADEYSRVQAGAFLGAALSQIAREAKLLRDIKLHSHLGAAALRTAHRARELLESASAQSVAQVAEEVGWTPDHLSRVCRAAFGVSPSRIRSLARLRRARELLSYGNTGVSNVAFGCGFSDVSHFIRLFQKEFGMTPGEFARLDFKT